jgi:DNA-binding NtrC family response regulator
LPEVFKDVLDTASRKGASLPITGSTFSRSRAHILAMFEKQYVLEQLNKHHGNVTASAKASGMTRQNFQRIMTRNKISAGKFRG